jgi:predicted TPR repeat methyltransferase
MDTEIDVWHICTQKFTYPALKRMLDEFAPRKTFANGVDLGCGTVTFFDWIEVENGVLVDLSEDYCAFMASKGWKVLTENIEDLSLESGSQDLVVCSDILEHVLSFDAAMSEVKRIMASCWSTFPGNRNWPKFLQCWAVTSGHSMMII